MAHLQAIAGGVRVPPPPPTFRETLTNVCRLGPAQADCLIAEGYDDVAELRNWETDAVDSWCKAKTKLTVNRGGCVFGDPKIRNIQAFAFWATDMHRRGRRDDLISFDADALGKYKEMVRVYSKKDSSSSDVKMPAPLTKESDWEDWEKELSNYLRCRDGVDDVPLQYIIRDEERPFLDAVAPDEQVREIDLIYNATMTGPAYQTDSGEVFGILDALTIGEDAANWIEPKTRRTRDGRQAMLDLKHHFDGDDEKYKRLEKAKNMMENLHYKNEQYMSWHIFSTRMKKVFDTIELCDPPGFTERTKVDTLLKKVQSNNQTLQTVGTQIRSDPVRFNSFNAVTSEFAKHIAYINPAIVTKPGEGKHRNKRRAASGKTANKVVSKNGKKFCNGVDVTDLLHSFSKNEWAKLSKEFKTELFENPERKNYSKKRKTNSGASAVDTLAGTLSEAAIGAVVSGVMRASLAGQPAAPIQVQVPVRQPRMGAGVAGVNTGGGSVVGSVITTESRWDHHGNRIT